MPGNKAGSQAEAIQDRQSAKPDLLSSNVYCNRDEQYKECKASEDEEFEVVFGGRNAVKKLAKLITGCLVLYKKRTQSL